MCGIFSIHDNNKNILEELLIKAIKSLSHRGPDGESYALSSCRTMGLAHSRLIIMDKKYGNQPMFDENKTISISVNGELYEDDKIRKHLQSLGHKFRTQSDSELLIYLYKEYGMHFVEYLRGEFAFVLQDHQKKLTIAGRDRFGIKPLCYHLSNNGTLRIASEAKAIFASGITAKWDEDSFYQTLCFQYTPQNHTLFHNIKQIAPGHLLVFDGSKLEMQQYWDIDYSETESTASLDELSISLHQSLKEAIAIRLRSENKKICCHLSGGIDSSSIAAIASKLQGKPIPCVSLSFPHKSYDEISIAQKQANFINSDFYAVDITTNDIISELPKAVYFSEGLAINSHLAAKFILNQEIKKLGFTIALTGEGADEAFNGYHHLKQDYLSCDFQKLICDNPLLIGSHISNDTTLNLDRVKQSLGHIPSFFKAKASMGHKLHQLFEKNIDQSNTVFSKILNENKNIKKIRSLPPVKQSAYLWIKYALSGYILKTLGDGCEMAHGIEGRVPFLDHHFFNFTQSIPLSYKIKNDIEKYILRKIAKPYVIPEIYHRKKHPLMAPPFLLTQSPKGTEFIHDICCSQNIKQLPFFDFKKVSKLIDSIYNLPFKEQVVYDPILMIIVTSALLQKQYNL